MVKKLQFSSIFVKSSASLRLHRNLSRRKVISYLPFPVFRSWNSRPRDLNSDDFFNVFFFSENWQKLRFLDHHNTDSWLFSIDLWLTFHQTVLWDTLAISFPHFNVILRWKFTAQQQVHMLVWLLALFYLPNPRKGSGVGVDNQFCTLWKRWGEGENNQYRQVENLMRFFFNRVKKEHLTRQSRVVGDWPAISG